MARIPGKTKKHVALTREKCPGCGRRRVLQTVTGKVRACADCKAHVGKEWRDR